jgi:hypothetical protein
MSEGAIQKLTKLIRGIRKNPAISQIIMEAPACAKQIQILINQHFYGARKVEFHSTSPFHIILTILLGYSNFLHKLEKISFSGCSTRDLRF